MRGIIVLSSVCLLALWNAVPGPTQNAQPAPKKPNWQGVAQQVKEITYYLNRDDLKSQKDAAQALGKIGAAVRGSASSLGVRLATHSDPAVRQACARALAEIGP